MKDKRFLVALALVGLFVAALLALPRGQAQKSPPRNLVEVAQVAREKGLHVQYDRDDGVPVGKVVVSAQPLSRYQCLRLLPAESSEWVGVVSVSESLPFPDDGTLISRWGRFYVAGDREIVTRLTQ
jgi:hypothetical protein